MLYSQKEFYKGYIVRIGHYRNEFFKDPRLPYVELRHTLNSGAHYRPHMHEQLSIGAIEEGAVSFGYAGHRSMLYPEALILINPKTIHACNPIEGEARSYYMLYINTEWAIGLQQSLFGDVDAFIPFAQMLVEEKRLYKKFLSLCALLLDQDALLLEREEGLELFMLEVFDRYCGQQSTSPSLPTEDTQSIKQVQSYLKAHTADNPTASEIANAVGLSRSHLIRYFKHTTGITPHAYLLNLKIEHAKELLHSDMPIAEIALEIGLSDQSHLNRLFKQYAACTPNEYRRGLV